MHDYKLDEQRNAMDIVKFISLMYAVHIDLHL